MASQKSSVNFKAQLASITKPVSVSSSNGNLRNSASFNERIANVRIEAEKQGLTGSCTWTGWGN